MKIVTWNCNGAFRKKYQALDAFDADLLIIQECENPEESIAPYRSWAKNYLWKRESKHKDIGIFAREGIELLPLDWKDDGLQSFLPCRVGHRIDLIAIWTKQANSPNFRYIGQLWKYLNLHKDKFEGRDMLLVGDLNSNTKWDEWDRWWNHSDVVKILQELHIVSIYHEHFEEKQGHETRPTLFHLRKVERPYHVDYAFASKQILDANQINLAVGERDDWLEFSDHMPISFSVRD